MRRWRKIDAEVMFSIVVYANMQGIVSSRAIEEACKNDSRFMGLQQIRLDFATAPSLFFIKNL